MLFKKSYAKLDENVKENIKNGDYIRIYNYIEEQINQGNTAKVSTIFDLFEDIENNSDVNDIINYEFNSLEDNEKYYNDCCNTLISYGLLLKQEELSQKLREAKDNNEKMEIAKELQNLISKRKGLKLC